MKGCCLELEPNQGWQCPACNAINEDPDNPEDSQECSVCGYASEAESSDSSVPLTEAESPGGMADNEETDSLSRSSNE